MIEVARSEDMSCSLVFWLLDLQNGFFVFVCGVNLYMFLELVKVDWLGQDVGGCCSIVQ